MRTLCLALALSLTTLPAFAGMVIDLPHLTWPQDDRTTGSTKGGAPASSVATAGRD